jgi:hypothetical protein
MDPSASGTLPASSSVRGTGSEHDVPSTLVPRDAAGRVFRGWSRLLAAAGAGTATFGECRRPGAASATASRVWVDVSLTQGRSWSQCGPYTRSQTNWISRPNGAWMRVCISADGISQCATNGNKRGPAGTAGGNLWCYDSDWTPY